MFSLQLLLLHSPPALLPPGFSGHRLWILPLTAVPHIWAGSWDYFPLKRSICILHPSTLQLIHLGQRGITSVFFSGHLGAMCSTGMDVPFFHLLSQPIDFVPLALMGIFQIVGKKESNTSVWPVSCSG